MIRLGERGSAARSSFAIRELWGEFYRQLDCPRCCGSQSRAPFLIRQCPRCDDGFVTNCPFSVLIDRFPVDEQTTVLLVEDDENDVLLFKRAVTKSSFPYRVQVARTGAEAIRYMRGEGEFADRKKFPFPKFVVTDSHMPLVSGIEFLQWLKNHPQFSIVPTILLGGSGAESDVEYAYDVLGVHGYIVKPADSQKLDCIVQLVFDYWAVCEVPLWKLKGEAGGSGQKGREE